MNHVYTNSDGELIAADTLEQAARFHDCELGGADEPDIEDWHQCSDDARIPVHEEDGTKETKTAAEWAAEHDTPEYVATTYM